MSRAEDAITTLKTKEASMRCSELTALLEGLGFHVRVGKSGKHRTVEHPGIPEAAGNFDGGHGKDAEIKTCYTREMKTLVNKYRDQLDKLENENGESA